MAGLQPFDKAPTLSSPTTLTHPSGVFISQLKQLRARLIVALIIRHYPALCLIYRSFYSVSDYTVPLSGYILFITLSARERGGRDALSCLRVGPHVIP